jgi:hypothetical protein
VHLYLYFLYSYDRCHCQHYSTDYYWYGTTVVPDLLGVVDNNPLLSVSFQLNGTTRPSVTMVRGDGDFEGGVDGVIDYEEEDTDITCLLMAASMN